MTPIEGPVTTPKNIETFNKGATLVFAKLYGAFPTPITISVELLDSCVSREEAEIFKYAMQFLEREGYVRVARYVANFYVAEGAVLTEKGLRALNATPKAIKQKGTVGQFVLKAAEAGTKELMSKAIGYTLGAVIQ